MLYKMIKWYFTCAIDITNYWKRGRIQVSFRKGGWLLLGTPLLKRVWSQWCNEIYRFLRDAVFLPFLEYISKIVLVFSYLTHLFCVLHGCTSEVGVRWEWVVLKSQTYRVSIVDLKMFKTKLNYVFMTVIPFSNCFMIYWYVIR